MRKIFILAFLVAALLILSGCTSMQETTTLNTDRKITIINQIGEITATPRPEIIVREPAKNHSTLKILLDAPDSTSISSLLQSSGFG